MKKEKEARKKKEIALFEIALMIMTTLAVAFVMQQSIASNINLKWVGI